jgi:sulfatase modifying factor 1
MSTSGSITFRTDMEADYAAEGRTSFEKIARQNRRPQYRRSGTAPGSVNGMHRRRQSRWTWGHGRGARLVNLRAIARCVVAAVAALYAVTGVAATSITLPGGNQMEFVTVGDPGNPGISGPAAFTGSVASTFDIGKYEVTNAQYVAFLNSVDPDGTNALNLYASGMATGQGGILLTPAAAAGSKYSTRTIGAESMANRPANFVSWQSAGRFVNWLQNGMSGPGTTETGAYNFTVDALNPPRNPGSQFWIPTGNEWFKAAFYDPATQTYSQFATRSNTAPIAEMPVGGSNSANWQSAVTYPPSLKLAEVGSYADSYSFYGAFDMNGGLNEWLENTNGTLRNLQGGTFSTLATQSALLSYSTQTTGSFGTAQSQWQGFRVAAVPEPSTIIMAMAGLTGLIGARAAQRRRRKLRA